MKWWFTDYDGTINRGDDVITIDDKKFINKWIKSGNKFTIASGKTYTEIKKVIDEHNFKCDYIISHNGAYLYDSNQKIISKLPIPFVIRESLWSIIENLKDKYTMGYCIKENRNDISYINTNNIKDKRLFIFDNRNIDLTKVKNDILFDPELVIVYVFLNEIHSDDIKTQFKNIKGIKAVNSHPNTIEIMNSLASKAHGIIELQKIYNFKTDDVITSGDAENDLEMIKFTNNSFAMAKGQLVVKQVAKHIVNDVNEIEKIIKI